MSNYGLTPRKPNRQPARPDLTSTVETRVHGRRLVAGQEVTVALTGRKTLTRATFLRYTRRDDGAEWLDVITGAGHARTVRPDAVKTVHRKADR